MPMQPSPSAETIGPPRPSFRCFIFVPPESVATCLRHVCLGQPIGPWLQPLGFSYLADPNARRDLFPAMAYRLKLIFAERAGFQQLRILLPSLRFGRADDGGVNSRHAQSKAQRDRDCLFQIRIAQEIVIQFSKSLPILVM